jgi:hypothetical protein
MIIINVNTRKGYALPMNNKDISLGLSAIEKLKSG